jgi:hypothetical protein
MLTCVVTLDADAAAEREQEVCVTRMIGVTILPNSNG